MPSADELISVILDDEENRASLRELVKQLQTPVGVIPFVGTGLSAPFGFPGWKDFLVSQARRVGVETAIDERIDAGQYEEAAEDLLQALGHRAFHDAIEDAFGDHKLEGKSLDGAVSLLPQLSVGPVITTNFDHVLERVFEKAGRRFEYVVWGAKADMMAKAFHQDRRFLLKIHGDVEDSTDRILTRSEYEKHYGGIDPSGTDLDRPLPRLLYHMLASRPLLFLGCSLSADRTLAVLKEIASRLPSVVHYAVVARPPSDAEFRDRLHFLSERGIRPIWYPQGRRDLIEPLLAYLAKQVPAHPQTGRSPSGNNRLLSGPEDPLLRNRSGFYGRTREVREVVGFLAGDGKLATITARPEIHNVKGAPGIGKTEVCKAALREYLAAHPGQSAYYVELSEAKDKTGFLSRLAQAFGVAEAVSEDQVLSAAAASPGVVYLDNLEDVVADRGAIDLLQRISQVPGVCVLASSRETLPGLARNITIESMDIEAAVQLSLQEWERSGTGAALADSPDLRDFLTKDLDCHPLSIVLVAAQAGGFSSLLDLRESWQKEWATLTSLPRGPEDRLTSLDVSVSRSYGVVLDEQPEAVTLWGLMGLFPEGMSAAARNRVFDGQIEAATRMRRLLLRLNLIWLDDSGSLHMLAPLRQFILARARKGEAGLQSSRLADMAYAHFYAVASEAGEHQFDSMHTITLDALLAEFTNLHHFVLFAASLGGAWPQKLSTLSFPLLNYYQFRVLLGEEILRCLLGLQQSADLILARAQSARYLGDVESRLGHLDKARQLYEEASGLYRKERADLGLANALRSLGDLARDGQDLDQATLLYTQAREMYIRERDNVGLAVTYCAMARLSHTLGDANKTDELLKEAVAAAEASNLPPVLEYVLGVAREIRPEADSR